jgi:hypothetical protein
MDDKARNVSARDAVAAIRGPMTNAQILQKFRVSPAGFGDLVRQLLAHKLLTEEDLKRRGIRFKVVKKEAQIPAIPTPAILPPPPDDNDEEFLDTVTLTELLTFKPEEPKIPGKKQEEKQQTEIPEVEPEEEKKSKFSLGGLFKKGK